MQVPDALDLKYDQKLRLVEKALELKRDEIDMAASWLQTEGRAFVIAGKLNGDEDGLRVKRFDENWKKDASELAMAMALPPSLCYKVLRLWNGDKNAAGMFLFDHGRKFREDKDVQQQIEFKQETAEKPTSLQDLLGLSVMQGGDSSSLLKEMDSNLDTEKKDEEKEEDEDEDDEANNKIDRNDFEQCELHSASLIGDNDLRNFSEVCSNAMYADRSFRVPHHCALVRGSLVYVIEDEVARPAIFLRLVPDSVLKLHSGEVKVGDLVRVREGTTPSYGWGPYVKLGDIGIVRERVNNERYKIDFDVAKGWVGDPRDLEVVSPPLVMTRHFDVETGRATDTTSPQHKLRVPVRMFSTRIESGTDLLQRGAASNEALGLAYARLAIVRLLRFSERCDSKKILLSPSKLQRTRSQVTCENRAKMFEPVTKRLLNLKKKEMDQETQTNAAEIVLRLLRLFAASQDEFSRMSSAPSYVSLLCVCVFSQLYLLGRLVS